MKRISVLVFFVFLSAFLFISPKNTYAICPGTATASQTTFEPTFRGEVTISNDQPCFQDAVTYIILAYPASADNSPGRYANFFTARVKPSSNSFRFTLDLRSYGKDNPGNWMFKVCQANGTGDCGDNNAGNILSKISSISVSAVPTATPTEIPANLPMVSVAGNQCIWQTGSSVEMILSNLKPNTNYRWWWDGDFGTKSDVITSNTSSFTIPQNETQKTGTRTFCLDISGVRRCSPGTQNSVTLLFEASPPTGDTSCNSDKFKTAAASKTESFEDAMRKIAEAIFLRPTPPALPCSYVTYNGGSRELRPKKTVQECAVVTTAIGDIHVKDLGAFIQDIFSKVLSIAALGAVILIIYSGYRLLISRGNKEMIQGAKDTITSAIVGLIFIVFALIILQVITVGILKLPGFE